MAGKELADKKGLNLEIKAEALELRSQMEKEVYDIEFTCELLRSELDLRERSHQESQETLVRENRALKKKLEKLEEVIGSIYGQRNPIETDFYGQLEEFVREVS